VLGLLHYGKLRGISKDKLLCLLLINFTKAFTILVASAAALLSIPAAIVVLVADSFKTYSCIPGQKITKHLVKFISKRQSNLSLLIPLSLMEYRK
jgi:hypothetical protein